MTPIDEALLVQVARDVCETMLNMTLSTASQINLVGPRMVASVQISGECSLKIEIETVRELAGEIACRMFSSKREDLNDSDLKDAFGEVANMIGGNVKGILSGELDLSLPVVEERNNNPSGRGSNRIATQLTCNGLPFSVNVLSISPDAVLV